MKEYYKAYDERYKTFHEKEDRAWAGDVPSYFLKNLFDENVSKKAKILEIGCGEGQNALYLIKNGYNILATDVSEEAIRWCKSKAREGGIDENKFDVLDILDNTLKEKFDVIMSISTLHMLVRDLDRKKFFDFVFEHLTDDGVAYVSVMGDGVMERKTNVCDAFKLVERDWGGKVVKVASTSCRIVDWDTLTREIENSNLKIINKFVTSEISGFTSSMFVAIQKN